MNLALDERLDCRRSLLVICPYYHSSKSFGGGGEKKMTVCLNEFSSEVDYLPVCTALSFPWVNSASTHMLSISQHSQNLATIGDAWNIELLVSPHMQSQRQQVLYPQE
jgi:hypothetical protein